MPTPTRVVVLGAGRVGSAIALDLAAELSFEVTVVDHDADRAELFPADSRIRFRHSDLAEPHRVREIVSAFDLVIGAVPGWMGYQTLQAAIEAGKNIVDISFFEEDPFGLDELARIHGVTAVVDCGVAPGLSNLVLGMLEREFDRIDSFRCLVGGLPERPTPPWNYKAPYSPSDVIEIYTRPARLVRGGAIVTVPALTELEQIVIPGIGLLDAFNTDGLRTLLRTTSIPELTEKTLRYPGHCDQIALFASAGFFDEKREVNGSLIHPREVSAKLLTEQWLQADDDHDMTVMRLVADGERSGKSTRVTYDLLDRFDRQRGISSMARTTGYPCAAVARLIARAEYSRPGIIPPELIGADADCYDSIVHDLEQRGVVFRVVEEELSAPSQGVSELQQGAVTCEVRLRHEAGETQKGASH